MLLVNNDLQIKEWASVWSSIIGYNGISYCIFQWLPYAPFLHEIFKACQDSPGILWKGRKLPYVTFSWWASMAFAKHLPLWLRNSLKILALALEPYIPLLAKTDLAVPSESTEAKDQSEAQNSTAHSPPSKKKKPAIPTKSMALEHWCQDRKTKGQHSGKSLPL